MSTVPTTLDSTPDPEEHVPAHLRGDRGRPFPELGLLALGAPRPPMLGAGQGERGPQHRGLEEMPKGEAPRHYSLVGIFFRLQRIPGPQGPSCAPPHQPHPGGAAVLRPVRQRQPRPTEGWQDTHRWLSRSCPEPGC